ncbi:unnamed protein product [Schistocephalus solidus]|uniref:Uncharacterized protein n=1 Tax=Schistocephalus solidus TaxID=70667 RepID=A0A183SJV3_SCHSO|nr:unnamed protein product [Schistocephalus solidus]
MPKPSQPAHTRKSAWLDTFRHNGITIRQSHLLRQLISTLLWTPHDQSWHRCPHSHHRSDHIPILLTYYLHHNHHPTLIIITIVIILFLIIIIITTTNSDADSVLNGPHCDRTPTSHISLVGHMRIHRTETGEQVPHPLASRIHLLHGPIRSHAHP